MTELKRTLYECQNPGATDRGDAERVERCNRRVSDLRRQINDMEARAPVLCDDEICLKELRKCDEYYRKLKEAIEA